MKQVAILPMAVIIAVLLSTCGGYKTHITPSQQLTLASANPLNEPTRTLVIEDVQITRNGQAQNIDPGLVQRFAFEIRRSGLFQTVYDPLNTHDEPKDEVRMKLYVTEMLDRHWGEKVGKDILVGLTYFTLAPLMPYQIQYDVSLRATVTLPSVDTRE